MKLKRLIFLVSLMAWILGTKAETVTIASADDWASFAQRVNNGENTLNAVMTQDVDLGSNMVMVGENWYCGDFNGGGHTLTIDITSTNDYAAPFVRVGGPIHNLHVKGTIRTSGRYAGGIAGQSISGTEIYQCWSSVTIISSYQGAAHCGGVLGTNDCASVTLVNDCLFDGKLLTTGGTTECGGFVGLVCCHLKIYSCLYAPADYDSDETPVPSNYMFYYLDNSRSLCEKWSVYYTSTTGMSTLQGTDASAMTPSEQVEALGGSWTISNGKPIPYRLSLFELNGSGTEDDPYLIGSVNDWCALANNVAAGKIYKKEYFKMTNDIDLGDCQEKVGTDRYPFGGNFDGQGHTLTIHYVSSRDYCAPFHSVIVDDITFKNLHVTGTINTSGKYAGGIIGVQDYNYEVAYRFKYKNLWSSVVITSTVEGEGFHGGIAGQLGSMPILQDCLFDGSIIGPTTSKCSGFVGYFIGVQGCDFINCLFNPKELDVIDDDCNTFAIAGWGGNVIVNSYYIRPMGKAGGIDASEMTVEDLLAGLGDFWELRDGQPVPITPCLIPFTGSGTEDDPYIISSADDWSILKHNVINGGDYSNKYFRQTNSFTTTEMVGTAQHPFKGNYEGGGNTITINIGSEDNPAVSDYQAPFRFVKQANFSRLHTDGTIHTAAKYASGMVGQAVHNCIFDDCRSSVTINSYVEGEGYHAGFVAESKYAWFESVQAVKFKGCVFDGKFLGERTSRWAGFVGWDEACYAPQFYDCFFIPAEVAINKSGSYSFSTDYYNRLVICQRSFYSVYIGGNKGEQVYRVTSNNGLSFTCDEQEPILTPDTLVASYEMNNILSYEKCINYCGTFYASRGAHVLVSSPEGYIITCEGKGVVSKMYDNMCRFSMGDSDVTVSVTLIDWAEKNEGTEEDPYVIYNIGQMDLLAQRVNESTSSHYTDKFFVLARDLEYDGTENNYTPVGFGSGNATYFGGTFNGQGHAISGINISTSSGRQGVFGVVSDGKVMNLTLANSTITGGDATGGIVGNLLNKAVVENCHVADNVAIGGAYYYYGGVVGHNTYGYIRGCTSAASVVGKCYVGGITGACGRNTSGTSNAVYPEVENCLYYGNSIEGTRTGAVVGNAFNDSHCTVTLANNYYLPTADICGTSEGDIVTNHGVVKAYDDITDYDMGDLKAEYEHDGAKAYANGINYQEKDYTCSLLLSDEGNVSDIISANAGRTLDVTLKGRTLYRDGSWNTICLPFDLDDTSETFLFGTIIETLSQTSYNEGTLSLNFTDSTSEMKAGKPYVMKWRSPEDTNIFEPVFANVTIVDDAPGSVSSDVVTFKAIYEPVVFEGEDRSVLYMGTDNMVYYPNAPMTIKGFRGYFVLNGLVCGDPVGNDNYASNIALIFGDDETTGISLTTKPSPLTSDYFTIDGRKLNGKPVGKGVYIYNGRKIVVK